MRSGRAAERFAAWVEAGHAGEMEWMKRAEHAVRKFPRRFATGDAVGAIGGRVRGELQR